MGAYDFRTRDRGATAEDDVRPAGREETPVP
jgi:hypothetical protein